MKISDAVASNFDPKGFKKLGLDYEKLKKYNPDIIVVNAPGFANWGPKSEFMSFGPNLQAISDITGSIGYPGQDPTGTRVPWVDYMGGAAIALPILVAMEYRISLHCMEEHLYIKLKQ